MMSPRRTGRDGRPLRFLAGLTGGWVTVRIGLLWHAGMPLPDAIRAVLPVPTRAIAAATPPLAASAAVTPATAPPIAVATRAVVPPPAGLSPAPDSIRVQMALIAMTRFGAPVDGAAPATPTAAIAQAVPVAGGGTALGGTSVAGRLSVSSWMIARGGTGAAAALAPQLGGTQGGIRVDYALAHGIAATARMAAPAAGAGRELSLGVAWRPRGVPLRVVAEQRLALDGGRGGPALGISGGVAAVQLPASFSLEGYAQAGAILRGGIDHYVDGSARATRVVGDVGGITLDAGAGAWGGAQRGVTRLDLGPSIGAAVPVAGRRLRVAVDWRQRVAGHARPGSGPSLTLGTDF